VTSPRSPELGDDAVADGITATRLAARRLTVSRSRATRGTVPG